MPPDTEDTGLRGDIEAALGDTGDDSGDSGAQAPSAPGSADGGTPAPSAESRPGEASPAGSPESTPPAGKVRDALGRFVPKASGGLEAPGAAQAPAGTQPLTPAPIAQPGPAPGPAAPTIPVPPSWTYQGREHWAALPVQVQQEVARREVEMQRFVNETAPARQLGESFYRAIQPHMATIQAEGVDPITAVMNLMQLGTRMRMGTPLEKAATVAQIVKAYGVDFRALDSALAGEQPQANGNGAPDAQYIQNAVQQALLPLYQAAQQRQQGLQQQADNNARSELDTFAADPKNRFFPDLRATMADMIEVAQRQGFDLSLADAYQRAGMLHPEISKAMIAERQGVNAHQLTAAAQRAKAAAISVKGSPAPVGNPNGQEPASIREGIEAAIEAHSRY